MMLPVAPDRLPELLSKPFGTYRAGFGDGLSITVSRAEVVIDESRHWVLLAKVRVTSSTNPDPQEWQITLPLGADDEEGRLIDATPSAFIRTLRANLEEWWHVKDSEPNIAAWGRRLS